MNPVCQATKREGALVVDGYKAKKNAQCGACSGFPRGASNQRHTARKREGAFYRKDSYLKEGEGRRNSGEKRSVRSQQQRERERKRYGEKDFSDRLQGRPERKPSERLTRILWKGDRGKPRPAPSWEARCTRERGDDRTLRGYSGGNPSPLGKFLPLAVPPVRRSGGVDQLE